MRSLIPAEDDFSSRPVNLYRWTQGLHVIAGTAAVPLLLVKLWTVHPKLFAVIPRGRRALVLHGLERLSIAVLVAGATFELATGLANSAQWYPWHFNFRGTHYAVAWITIGALLVHVAVKLPVIRAALGSDVEASQSGDRQPIAQETSGLSRRALLWTTWLAAGVAVLATARSAVPLLRRVSVLGVRSGAGPQDVPVNKSAVAAQVIPRAMASSYQLSVMNGTIMRRLTRADCSPCPRSRPPCRSLAWKAGAPADCRGVRVRELLRLVEAPPDSDVVIRSLQPSGSYIVTDMTANFVADDDTRLALELNGDALSIDHGFPCRIIAPARPGVLQTRWVSSIEVAT